MKTLKIYSQHRPVKINGIHPLFAETYTVDINGVKSNSTWYSELETTDYYNTRVELEKSGYIAHPASSKEIESKEYTIFKV